MSCYCQTLIFAINPGSGIIRNMSQCNMNGVSPRSAVWVSANINCSLLGGDAAGREAGKTKFLHISRACLAGKCCKKLERKLMASAHPSKVVLFSAGLRALPLAL